MQGGPETAIPTMTIGWYGDIIGGRPHGGFFILVTHLMFLLIACWRRLGRVNYR